MARGARRALDQVGGQVDLHGGTETERAALKHALSVRPDERATQAHVHGFHSYAARIHPLTAARLVEGFSEARARVLDPFCGSGTVLVEAQRLGRAALGTDLNPLAITLSRVKLQPRTKAHRRRLVEAAQRVRDHADERRLTRAGPTRPYPDADRRLFDVHVLLELDGLHAGIRSEPDTEVRVVLELVLSATLSKVSRQAFDASGDAADSRRRIAAGFAARFFVDRARELSERLAEYAELIPPNTPQPLVRAADARDLGHVTPSSIDLIVTSPPYPGVYDYYYQHSPRLRWLGLEGRAFARQEIGSRRQLNSLPPESALAQFQRDFLKCLRQMRQVLRPGGRAVVVCADSALGDLAVQADELIAELVPAARLRVVAQAAQLRRHFHSPSARAFRQRPRREHVIVLSA